MQTPGFFCKEAPTVAELQQTEHWQRLYARYTALRTQIDIAEQFCTWARERADGEHLMLQAKAESCYVFIGDTHGNFEALLSIICHINATACNKRPHFILLGDCIDRGDGDLATLALIEESLMNKGTGTFDLSYLCGNHDFALAVQPNGYFFSAVSPADTADKLNSLSKQGRAAHALCLGKAAMELARTAPFIGELTAAIPGQTNAAYIFAHACTPHTDAQALLDELYPQRPINTPYTALPDYLLYPCRDDCLRGLLREEATGAPPNRGFAATRQSPADAEAYFDLHRRLTGRRILGMFRGHDHIDKGCRLLHTPSAFICTLNALGPQATTAAIPQADGNVCLLHFAN